MHHPGEVFVLVPLKQRQFAKSRMRGALNEDLRQAIALAMAQDVIDSVAACGAVKRTVVVGDSDGLQLRSTTTVLGDSPGAGLNAALVHAVRATRTTGDAAILVVAADLPCLRTTDLTELLSRAPRTQPGFVADHTGSGTAMLWLPSGTDAAPYFGVGSADKHRALKYVDLTHAVSEPSRFDVDTIADLTRIGTLGPGPHTRQILREHLDLLS